MNRTNTLKHHGQSLIEIVVAVGIIAVVLVGVSDLITRSLSMASFQNSKNTAINIAQNQLNYYRQVKDQEPSKFFTENINSQYGTCVGDDYDKENFVCTINYVTGTVGGVITSVEMTVNIQWKDGDKVIDTKLTQTLARPTK